MYLPILISGEVSDEPSELSSKELNKFMISEDVSLDTVLMEDESLPVKKVLLPSEFCYTCLLVSPLLSLFYSTQGLRLTFVVAAKDFFASHDDGIFS